MIFVLLLAGVMLSSFACTPSIPQPSLAPPTLTSLLPSPTPSSGDLRVWVTPFSSFPDPLHDTERTHQAVFRLIYQGLFALESDSSVQPVLCSSWEISANGFFLTVHLTADARFHDGTWVTAQDVKASFDAIKADAHSPFFERLARIDSATVLNPETLRFGLAQPGFFALYALTFPVIPAAAATAENPPASNIPGTGPYRLRSQSDAPVSVLERVGASGRIRTIRLVEQVDVRAAVSAMEDDLIDLIELDAAAFRLYQQRQDLSLYHYAGSAYLFFALQAEQGQPLADPDRFAQVRMVLDRVRSSADSTTAAWSATALPASPLSCVLDGGDVRVTYPEVAAENTADAWSETRALVLLYPENDPLRADLAAQTISALEKASIPAQAVGIEAQSLAERLAARTFDVALLSASLSFVPDPTWLYIPDGTLTIPGMENLPLASPWPESFHSAVDDLRHATARLSPGPDWRQVRNALVACAQTAPVIGIGFIREGILAGHRVKGQFASIRDNPYFGINEVWVWSGS